MKEVTLKTVVQYLTFEELSPDEQNLISKARRATAFSHSPYSNFQVGCAILVEGNQYFTGANQENAAYPSGMCAERTTINATWNAGHHKDIRKIAVTAKPSNVENYSGDTPVCPCGACRQVMYEAEERAGEAIIVLMDCFNNKLIARIASVKELLPLAFGPKALGIEI